jgi:hypothetical protein
VAICGKFTKFERNLSKFVKIHNCMEWKNVNWYTALMSVWVFLLCSVRKKINWETWVCYVRRYMLKTTWYFLSVMINILVMVCHDVLSGNLLGVTEKHMITMAWMWRWWLLYWNDRYNGASFNFSWHVKPCKKKGYILLPYDISEMCNCFVLFNILIHIQNGILSLL